MRPRRTTRPGVESAGPWTSSANLNISFNPMKVRLPQRATLTFNINNPLGAADILLHGESKDEEQVGHGRLLVKRS